MEKKMYQISEDAYLRHVSEKLYLCNMLRATFRSAEDLPDTPDYVNFKFMCSSLDKIVQRLVDSWDMPFCDSDEDVEGFVCIPKLLQRELLSVEGEECPPVSLCPDCTSEDWDLGSVKKLDAEDSGLPEWYTRWLDETAEQIAVQIVENTIRLMEQAKETEK